MGLFDFFKLEPWQMRARLQGKFESTYTNHPEYEKLSEDAKEKSRIIVKKLLEYINNGDYKLRPEYRTFDELEIHGFDFYLGKDRSITVDGKFIWVSALDFQRIYQRVRKITYGLFQKRVIEKNCNNISDIFNKI
jgi:hypothetical protein